MQKRGNQLIYSPSDLIRFLDSPYSSWMERFHLEFPDTIQPDEETAEQKLVAKTGDQHEAKYLNFLESHRFDVFQLWRTRAARLEFSARSQPSQRRSVTRHDPCNRSRRSADCKRTRRFSC